MDRTSQGVVGENCVCNDASEIVLTDEGKIKAGVEYHASLLSVEFEWPSNELSEAPPTAAPAPAALSKMKCSKAAGPSGIIVEML